MTARTPASTALWGYLLRKDVNAPPVSTSSPPPIAPLDRTGTSMRLLLHDTQANLQKFSERVDKLMTGVQATKHEMDAMKNLWDGESERAQKEISDAVTRCQTSIQASLGTPAQSHSVESLAKDVSSVDHKQDSLEKRVDALQMLNQTQSQSLQSIQDQISSVRLSYQPLENRIDTLQMLAQTQSQNIQMQSQTLQTVLDQLASMLPALLPLLPLVQSLPLHLDTAKISICDTIRTSADRLSQRPCEVRVLPSDNSPATTLKSALVPDHKQNPSSSSAQPNKLLSKRAGSPFPDSTSSIRKRNRQTAVEPPARTYSQPSQPQLTGTPGNASRQRSPPIRQPLSTITLPSRELLVEHDLVGSNRQAQTSSEHSLSRLHNLKNPSIPVQRNGNPFPITILSSPGPTLPDLTTTPVRSSDPSGARQRSKSPAASPTISTTSDVVHELETTDEFLVFVPSSRENLHDQENKGKRFLAFADDSSDEGHSFG